MSQLTLIQAGEFIVCEETTYFPPSGSAPASLHATAALPINTMQAIAVRLDNEIVPLPFLRSRERRVVTQRIRVDGPIATRIARSLDLPAAPSAPAAAS